jgi:hypothetical protein
MDVNIIGKATMKALAKNGRNDPSLNILIKSKGIHPIGAVFLIIN